MNISIRQIERQDLPVVLDFLRELAAFENLSEYCEVTENRLDAAMFGDNSVVQGLIAFDGETAVGYALFYPNFSSFRGQCGMHLDDIYIKSEYRGKGVGEKMLQQVARITASRGFERIDFNVLDLNAPAIRFYKRLGAVFNDEETHFKFSDEAFRTLSS